jgi:ketosteroid isomerase-like protein
LANDFILNRDGSVADIASGLVWQGSSAQYIPAQSVADYCEQFNVSTQYFWRLPTQTEISALEDSLQSISPGTYWVADEGSLDVGLYCFGDGAYFQSGAIRTSANIRCVSDNPLAPVIEAVRAWAASWQKGDIEGYLSAYVDEFQPRSDIEHAEWKKQRIQRVARATEISIKLETEAINPLNEDFVEIVFLQDYRARHFQDRVRKRLLLKQQQGRWLIAKEEQLSSLPGQTLSAAAIYYQ